jgi:zinc protease
LCLSVCVLSQDYLLQYRAGVEAVTPADVLAAARRHLHPDGQTIVIIADAGTLLPELEAQGRTVLPLVVQDDGSAASS